MFKFFNRIQLPDFLLTETPLVLGATFALRFSKFFIFIYAAKILGPSGWGLWTILLIFSMYFSHFHMGLINAFNREGTIYLDDKNYFQYLSKNIFSGQIILLFLFSLALFFTINFATELNKITLVLFLVYFIINQLYYFIEIYFKVQINFIKIAYFQIFHAVLLPLVSFFLINEYNLNGFLLSLSLPLIVLVLININVLSNLISFKIDKLLLKKFIAIGFPIMIVGFTFMLIQTVDRLVIMRFFDSNDLGIYSLGSTIFQALLIFPQILSMQFYPRMIQTYGKEKNLTDLKNSFFNLIFISLMIVLPVVLVTFFLVPIIINLYLSDYISSIFISKILIVTVVFLPIAFVSGMVLNILNLQVRYLFFQIIAVIINLIFSLTAVNLGFGINGVAFATLISFLSYSLLLLFYIIFYVFRQEN